MRRNTIAKLLITLILLSLQNDPAHAADSFALSSIMLIRYDDFSGNFERMNFVVSFTTENLDNLTTLKITDPDGTTIGYFDKSQIDRDPHNNVWQAATSVAISPKTGTYKITFTSSDLTTETVNSTVVSSDIPTETPVITFPEYASQTITTPVPTFTWEDFPCTHFFINIDQFIYDAGESIWWTDSSTYINSVVYNADGTASIDELPPGTYQLLLCGMKDRYQFSTQGCRSVDFIVSDTSGGGTTTTTTVSGTTTTTAPAASGAVKAVIVAGGGPFQGNTLWDATSMLANYAYKALKYQGFTSDAIYYLTAESQVDIEPDGIADADADATNDNLRYAVTPWASEADDVIVYMTDHGGSGTFRMSEAETLYAAQLQTWLEELQGSIPGRIIFIYDACESGSFMPLLAPPSGKDRIIIASASADEPAYFVTGGTVSFSHYFWSNVFNGDDLYDAFRLAKDAMAVPGYQSALLDDSGNGIANEKDDGRIASGYVIGAGKVKGEDIPSIGTISDNQTLYGETAAEIRAGNITASSSIVMVWALIKPPRPAMDNSSGAVVDIPSVVLTKGAGNEYKGTYNGFTAAGTYRISVYAMDEKANTSLPETTSVIQTRGTACPAVLVAGGENETTALLRRFRDEVLMKTSEGREYVRLFYRHAPELLSILLSNPEITAECKAVLKSIVPTITLAMNHNRNIKLSDLISDENILSKIRAGASSDFKKDLARIAICKRMH